MTHVLAFIGGLIVGWNFMAQPDWVKNFIDKIKAKFSRKPPTTPPA